MRLRPFSPALAAMVASWATSPPEVAMWCGVSGAPVLAETIAGWADEEGVAPFGLYAEEQLVAYGELWPDEDEAAVELARLIVDPNRRGQGVGRVLAAALAAEARSAYPEYPGIIMRVHPENIAALRCYAAAGFVRVRPEQEAEWNAPPQPVRYVWLTM